METGLAVMGTLVATMLMIMAVAGIVAKGMEKTGGQGLETTGVVVGNSFKVKLIFSICFFLVLCFPFIAF